MLSDQDLILTKLMPPTNSGRVIQRPTFDPLLHALPECPVTLICAPAGYGKSTLMAQWYRHVEQLGAHAGWLSLETQERNIATLLTYLTRLLMQMGAVTGLSARGMLASWHPEKAAAVIGSLMREVADYGQHLVLFIDDYHSIDTPETARIMEELIHHLPDNLLLILSSRQRPQFPVGSLKVHHRLKEINATHLRFSESDVAEFTRQQLQQDLDAAAIQDITRKTEGWPAAIQLVTLALIGSHQYQEVLNKISGNVLDIADYLAKDVLGNLPQELQQFLLHTAVLNRFQVPLCEAVNPGANNRQLIEQCLTQNLFLIPLDQTEGWYRYHYLFRDFLLNQLAMRYPQKLTELHRKASHWLAEQNFIDDAVNHAIEGQDFPFLAELVERHAKNFITRGHMTQVLEWTSRIPDDLIADNPNIPAYKCCALFHMRRPAEAAQALREAERRLERLEQQGIKIPGLRDELNVYRSGTAVAADDVVSAKTYALEPVSHQIEPFIQGAQQNILGYCYFAQGDYPQAKQALARAYAFHEQCDSTYGIVYAHCFSALVEMAQGNLFRAEELCSLAEKTAELEESWRSYISAEPSLYRGAILYEWNQIEDAKELLEQNLSFVEECSQAGAPILGHILMARIHYREGNTAQAHSHLQRAQTICQGANLRYQRLLVVNEQIRLLVLEGQIYRALAAANLLGIQPHSDASNQLPAVWERESCWRLIAQVRLLLGLNEHSKALSLIEPLLALADATETIKPKMLLRLLKTQALWLQQEFDSALAVLSETAQLAQVGPYLSIFIDEAPFYDALMAQFDPTHPEAKRIRSLLQRDTKASPETNSALPTTAESDQETLSGREAEILKLIALGNTNREIGEKLFIADSTVKWHLKNIFEKLNVRNRTSAVFVGKAMGIVE